MKKLLTVIGLMFFIAGCSPEDNSASDLADQIFKDGVPLAKQEILNFTSCAEGPVKVIPLYKSDYRDDYFNDVFLEQLEYFVILAEKLNESCFGKLRFEVAQRLYSKDSERVAESDLNPSNHNFNLKFSSERAGKDQTSFEQSKVLSPFQTNCFERCKYVSDQMLKIGSNYYFLSRPSDGGVEVSMINKDVIHFEVHMATRTHNIILYRENNQIVLLPSGSLEFLDDGIIVRGAKSYLKEGGAFWYDSKLDYQGNTIHFLDVVGGAYTACINIEEFNEDFMSKLHSLGLSRLCVER